MPDALRWFADNQPFTPIIETLRGLLLGTPIGDRGLLAIAWCVGISVVGYLWSRRLYDRIPARLPSTPSRRAPTGRLEAPATRLERRAS